MIFLCFRNFLLATRLDERLFTEFVHQFCKFQQRWLRPLREDFISSWLEKGDTSALANDTSPLLWLEQQNHDEINRQMNWLIFKVSGQFFVSSRLARLWIFVKLCHRCSASRVPRFFICKY
jgi:hypothetical protein